MGDNLLTFFPRLSGQMLVCLPLNMRLYDAAFGVGLVKADFGKLFGPAHMGVFHQDGVLLAKLCL